MLCEILSHKEGVQVKHVEQGSEKDIKQETDEVTAQVNINETIKKEQVEFPSQNGQNAQNMPVHELNLKIENQGQSQSQSQNQSHNQNQNQSLF